MTNLTFTETEKKVIIPFIKANNLHFPIYMTTSLKGIKIESYKTKLNLNRQESFFIYLYLTGRYPKNKRFKIESENHFSIIE